MDATWLAVIVVLALVFDFLNGFNDSGNVVATMVYSGAMSPRRALLLASIAELVGPFIFGVAVAATIGKGIVQLEAITPGVVFASLVGAILWNALALRFAVPSSSTHALVGGLVGAALAARGSEAVQWGGLAKVVAVLVLAPLVGGLLGYLVMALTLFFARGATPAANLMFRRLQIVTSIALALSHGTNDAQKTMGVITMSLVAFGVLPGFEVPFWVVALSAACLSIGVASGGWGTIRTLGARMYRIRPVHGFAAQAASTVAVLGAALLGGPVSTSQVVGSAILGVGTAQRRSQVRWEVASSVVTAWMLTLPVAAGVSAVVYQALNLVARW